MVTLRPLLLPIWLLAVLAGCDAATIEVTPRGGSASEAIEVPTDAAPTDAGLPSADAETTDGDEGDGADSERRE